MLEKLIICLSILLLPVYVCAVEFNEEEVVPEGDGSSVVGKINRISPCSKSELKFNGNPAFCKKIIIKQSNAKDGDCIIFTNTTISSLKNELYDGGQRNHEPDSILAIKLDSIVRNQLKLGRNVSIGTVGKGCVDITIK